jgi:hypothetical protein
MSGEYATYLIRTLLSEGCLRHGTVESTPEGLKPMMVVREGPAGLITTTTQVNLHAENETRLISVPVDDTRDHTAAVMKAIASRNGRTVDMAEWHELQFWLADGDRRVEVPFAERLAHLIPPVAVRLRRDFKSLALVQAHALLHRANRDVGDNGIVATIDDYDAVRDLVLGVISEGLNATVSAAIRETVEAIAEITAGDDGLRASNAQLEKRLKIDRSAVYRRVAKAITQGYVINDEDRPRKPTRLRLAESLPEDEVILPERACVAGLCTCALHSGEGHTPPTSDAIRPAADDPVDDPVAKLFKDAGAVRRRDTRLTDTEQELADRYRRSYPWLNRGTA